MTKKLCNRKPRKLDTMAALQVGLLRVKTGKDEMYAD